MVRAEAARNGWCRVSPVGAVSKGLLGEEMAELAELRGAGCVAVSDDGKPVWNAQLMRRDLEYCSMLGIPVIAHDEDANLNEHGVMHEGYYSTLLGMRGIPAASARRSAPSSSSATSPTTSRYTARDCMSAGVPRMCMRTTGAPASATARASSGSASP